MLHLPTEVDSDYFLVPKEQEKPSDIIIGLRDDYFSVEVKKASSWRPLSQAHGAGAGGGLGRQRAPRG